MSGLCPLPRTAEPARDSDPGHGYDAGTLGQAISDRLFSAGLDLHSALNLAGDGPVADGLRQAVAELDEALIYLRHLMLAMPGPTAGAAVPDGFRRDQGTRPG